MEKNAKTVRTAILEQISLFARASAQIQYETDVPIGDVPAELISGFCDDSFHPKNQTFLDAFNEDEIKDLATLFGLLHLVSRRINEIDIYRVVDLQKLAEWRAVMNFAKELEARFN